MKNLYFNKRKYFFLCFLELFLKVGCLIDVISGKFFLVILYFCLGKIWKCIIVIDVLLCGIMFYIVYVRNLLKVLINFVCCKFY